MFRNASLRVVVLLATVVGCAAPGADGAIDPNGATAEAALDPTSGEAEGRECVIDTVMMKKGFLADFKGAVGASFLKSYGPTLYPHIEIPGAFDAALPPNPGSVDSFYTVLGLDIGRPSHEDGSTDETRLTATLNGNPPSDPLLTTSARTYAAAKATFDAMTRAVETKEEHVAVSAFDRDWKKTTRASAAGRVVCTAVTYPGSSETRPTYSCTFYDVERTFVQVFNTAHAGGKCLAATR